MIRKDTLTTIQQEKHTRTYRRGTGQIFRMDRHNHVKSPDTDSVGQPSLSRKSKIHSQCPLGYCVPVSLQLIHSGEHNHKR